MAKSSSTRQRSSSGKSPKDNKGPSGHQLGDTESKYIAWAVVSAAAVCLVIYSQPDDTFLLSGSNDYRPFLLLLSVATIALGASLIYAANVLRSPLFAIGKSAYWSVILLVGSFSVQKAGEWFPRRVYLGDRIVFEFEPLKFDWFLNCAFILTSAVLVALYIWLWKHRKTYGRRDDWN